MKKTVKFAVSMPAADFRELEICRRKTGRTRSQFIRDAVRASKPASRPSDKVATFPAVPEITDPEERRKRAIAAAGRFRSGLSDLSSNHDRYLDDAFSAAALPEDASPGRKTR